MTLPRPVAEVIRQHVTLQVEGIDRMYLNVYQPRLKCEGQVAAFFRSHQDPNLPERRMVVGRCSCWLFGEEKSEELSSFF